MKATNQNEANRIAAAGARKMTVETHEIQPCSIKSLRLKQFTVTNKANGETYQVSVDLAKTFCQCGFYIENREFGTCKHLVKCREESAELEALETREEGETFYIEVGQYL